MALDQDFNKAAEDVKNLAKRPNDNEFLELYALFKQATVGDINIDRPGTLEFKTKSKWDSWNGKKGMSKDEAKKLYVAHVTGLKTKYN